MIPRSRCGRLAFWLTPLLLSCASVPAVQREPADLVIRGGTILTMAGPNLEDGTIVIRDGAIVAVGTGVSLADRYAASEVVNANGMAVLPGFVNTHTHAPMALFRGIADDRALMDWLENYIFPAESQNVDAEFVRWGTRLAALEMIASGTTTLADMYYFEAVIAEEVRRAGLRGVLGQTLIGFPVPDSRDWAEAVEVARQYVARFRGDPLITPAIAPHAPYTLSADQLKESRALATELGVPILIHVAETRSELSQLPLSPGLYLDSLGFLGPDVVAAHAVWLTPEEIRIFAARGVGVAHNAVSNMMLASGVAPIPALLEAGVAVGLGTDGPASNNNLDMFDEMATAARLQKVTRMDPTAASARQMLELATIGGARALGLDDRIGTLEVGKRADLIVVELRGVQTQPVYAVESALVYAANGHHVRHTIVEGRVLMRDRRVLTIDVDETLRQAAAYRDRIVARLRATE